MIIGTLPGPSPRFTGPSGIEWDSLTNIHGIVGFGAIYRGKPYKKNSFYTPHRCIQGASHDKR